MSQETVIIFDNESSANELNIRKMTKLENKNTSWPELTSKVTREQVDLLFEKKLAVSEGGSGLERCAM